MSGDFTPRRSWPYVKTPIWVFLVVMGLICFLMAFILLESTLPWMKWSAGFVILVTIVAFCKGYVRRLVLTERGVRMLRLFSAIDLPWRRIKRVGVYVPGGGVGATEYVFITARGDPPAGKWELDDDVIQLQNRPGLLEAIEAARRECNRRGAA